MSKAKARAAAQAKAQLSAALFSQPQEQLSVVEVEDAYEFIERMKEKNHTRVAESVRALIEGQGVKHLRDSVSEKVHSLDVSIPFTFNDLFGKTKYKDKLGKALKNPVHYDGENKRGYICEVVATEYGHNAQNDIDLSLDVVNEIATLTASITAGSPIQANIDLLQQIKNNATSQLRVSYVASSNPIEVKEDLASSSAASSSSSSSLIDVENEMRRQISQETAQTGRFKLAHPEVLQYDSPHVRKVYDAFAGVERNSLMKGVVVVDAKSNYKYVVETSALAPAIKHHPNTRFAYRGYKQFEAGAIHVFRVHKDFLSKIVDTVCANAKEVEKLARRIEDIQCTLVSHLPWVRQGNNQFHSPDKDLYVKGNEQFCFNVRLEVKALYYNEANCFASDPLNVGIWFAPVYKREDVNYETGSVISEAKPLYDPTSKAASEMLKQVTSEGEVVDDNQSTEASSSSSSSTVSDD